MKTDNTQRILQELYDLVEEMREESEVDARTILHYVRKYQEDEEYSCGNEE